MGHMHLASWGGEPADERDCEPGWVDSGSAKAAHLLLQHVREGLGAWVAPARAVNPMPSCSCTAHGRPAGRGLREGLPETEHAPHEPASPGGPPATQGRRSGVLHSPEAKGKEKEIQRPLCQAEEGAAAL